MSISRHSAGAPPKNPPHALHQYLPGGGPLGRSLILEVAAAMDMDRPTSPQLVAAVSMEPHSGQGGSVAFSKYHQLRADTGITCLEVINCGWIDFEHDDAVVAFLNLRPVNPEKFFWSKPLLAHRVNLIFRRTGMAHGGFLHGGRSPTAPYPPARPFRTKGNVILHEAHPSADWGR